MGYIVALDIGIASVGWAVIDKESESVVEAGSNIFPEASATKNLTRRNMRQGKRLKRRQKTRLRDFQKLWTNNGFSIPEVNRTDIVDLKVKALSEEITLEELYLILYSYLKHRGISYLEDAEDDNTQGSSAYARGLRLNQEELETKFPSEIQRERLLTVGQYRGNFQIKTEGNETIDLSNVFTIGSYREEISKVLSVQKEFHTELSDEFCDEYLMIFNRKRKYYEGPGNENSRTDYGKYTTKVDENGDYITESNIFEKLIGKCSVYPEELRASAASYTAQEFNLLNDLNNLVVNGRKLEEEEKRQIVSIVKEKDTINMKKIIAGVIGESIDEWSGARVDKDEKEIFHKFSAYNKMRKLLAEKEYDITEFTREELDEIGYILTINTDKESIIEAFNESELFLDDNLVDCLVDIRKKNGSLFNKWHSFSIKLMNELIPEMYEQPKEQMTLLTEMRVFSEKADEFKGLKYIPVEAASEELLNPVVRRSVRISFRILNALIKKYKCIESVVIEMPRDRNSDEEKKRIKDAQKLNEKEIKVIQEKLSQVYKIDIKPRHYAAQKQLNLKLKLWNEQDGICLYSGRRIDPRDLLEKPDMFEVDHIIPRSISFDDSRNNKVLVYRTENQKKGNNTPYFYLTHSNGEYTFDHYKARVLELSKKKEYGLSRKKVQNLLFSKDITKIDVLSGFISRNLNDTRYASRVVLNTVQSFFSAKEEPTTVKVIRGSFTHQMRVNMHLPKDREESYSHHAVDAMLIAFSRLGYEAYHKLQGSFIDFETGEILDQRMWEEKMSDDVYAEYLYGAKWTNIRDNITRAEKEVKYWHYVDRKCNRGLCNQTIRGTREYDGKTQKINYFYIRTDEGVKKFKKYAMGSEKDKERLLVYRHDRKTFDLLISIFNTYADAKNPFLQYEAETGDVIRKYSKKNNGPRINRLDYIDRAVDTCIDISHKYGFEKGSRKVILDTLAQYRTDVYYHPTKGYYLVGVRQSDVKCEGSRYVIDEEAYATILLHEKMIKAGQGRRDLADLGFEFKFSFYKNDIIEYEKNGEIYRERFLSRSEPNKKNNIETKPIQMAEFPDRKPVRLSKTTLVKKYRMDILGNYYLCSKEDFSRYC